MIKPILAITMGDPCGVGPEVIVKVLADSGPYAVCRPFVVGDALWMAQAASQFASSVAIRPIGDLSEARFEEGVVEVLDSREGGLSDVKYGVPSPRAGRAALRALEMAAHLALTHRVDGITTAPINKEQMKSAGFNFPGHTEFFAHAAGVSEFGMMMVGGGLKILLTTIHLSLQAMISQLSSDQIFRAIGLLDRSLQTDFGIKAPRIAVCALNPHAGEAGLMGDEEQKIVAPAVAMAASRGINIHGPYPADTLFFRLKQGQFDAAVALYHDQALIPIKLLSFGGGINVTVGLPFVRTSVDHGTAYDIAGQGVADPGSLREALLLAVTLAQHRRHAR